MTNRLIAAALAALLAAPALAGSDSTTGSETDTEASAGTAADQAAAEADAAEETGEAAASETSGTTDDGVSTPPEPFTEEFLANAAHVEAGKAIWDEQCRHCHGKSAYPGKAPKLKPAKYEPDFVYRRVTDGFRKMPAWKEVYTDEERMQVTAYILSDGFSP